MLKNHSKSIKVGTVIPYGHKILIFAHHNGSAKSNVSTQRLDVYNSVSRKRRTYHCTGMIPQTDSSGQQSVFNNKVFMWIKFLTKFIYVLDLETCHWERHKVSGIPPLTAYRMSTWKWKDKFYLFGGYGEDPTIANVGQDQVRFSKVRHSSVNWLVDQCVALDTTTLSCEWPRWSGDFPPIPRSNHRSIVCGDYMLLFGGSDSGDGKLKDLSALHMPTHRWTALQERVTQNNVYIPLGYYLPCFISVGKNRAILCSGHGSIYVVLSDCWLLTWSTTEETIDQVKWNQWNILGNIMRPKVTYEYAQPVYISDTSRVYFNKTYMGPIATKISILVNPPTLYEAAMATITENKIPCAYTAH